MTTSDKKTIEVSVAVLGHFEDSKLLIARRSGGRPYAGYWEFPGGKLEVGESPLECLYRELEEELGITSSQLSNVKFVGIIHTENNTAHYVLHVFVADLKTRSFTDTGVHTEVIFATLEDLIDLHMIPSNSRVLDMATPELDERVHTGKRTRHKSQ
jgi:mutator protein MutT